MSTLFAQTKHKQVMIRFVCLLKPSGSCMETELEGSRCGSGKALDKFRQARMLVGTVVIMVRRREAGDGRTLCPSQAGRCRPLPEVNGLSLAFSQAWAWGGAGGPRRGLVFFEVPVCGQTCSASPALMHM